MQRKESSLGNVEKTQIGGGKMDAAAANIGTTLSLGA